MINQVATAMCPGASRLSHGVTGLTWMANDSEQWCITDAPNADAVRKHHEGMGLTLGPGDVTEIKVVRCESCAATWDE
jgi:hypothetical protein